MAEVRSEAVPCLDLMTAMVHSLCTTHSVSPLPPGVAPLPALVSPTRVSFNLEPSYGTTNLSESVMPSSHNPAFSALDQPLRPTIQVKCRSAECSGATAACRRRLGVRSLVLPNGGQGKMRIQETPSTEPTVSRFQGLSVPVHDTQSKRWAITYTFRARP
jgi:hypothetical protein